MNTWVFKATPRGEHAYDYSTKLRVGHEEKWHSAKTGDSMRVGDRVFFWATTPLLHVAGLGVVTHIHPRGGISVRYLTNLLSRPPTIAELKTHPALENARFLKRGAYGTVFELTRKEAQALHGLVVTKNPGADTWPELLQVQSDGDVIDPLLFEIGAKFNDGLLTLAEAQTQLVKLGINRGSATNYLYNTKHLLAGRCYKRHMTIAPTTAFLAWIKRHRSPLEYRNSLQALEAHLHYRESSGIKHPRHRELLSRLQTEALADVQWSPPRTRFNSARDDLSEDPPTGCEAPKQTTRTVTSYPRDPAVRDYVLKQAKGRCEYCGQLGFLKPNGEHYLESHHLLALSEDGPDTTKNVVALCANHHREAHYGSEREKLEAAIVAKRQCSAQSLTVVNI